MKRWNIRQTRMGVSWEMSPGTHVISYSLKINPVFLLSTPPPPFFLPGNLLSTAGTQVDEGVRSASKRIVAPPGGRSNITSLS